MSRSDLPSSPALPSSPGAIEDASALLQRATDQHRQGALEMAESLYRELLAREPDHFDALNRLGILQMQRGELEDACRLLAAATARNPQSDAALSNYASVLLELKRFEEALHNYDLALALKPDEPYLLYNRARALREMGRYPDALACLDRLLAIAPGDQQAAQDRVVTLRLFVEAMFSEVTARFKRGDATGGYRLSRDVLAIEPNHFGARWISVMGGIPNVYSSLEEMSAARDAFAAGLDLLNAQLDGGVTWQDELLVTPFFLAYREENNTELISRYGQLWVRANRPLAMPRPARRRAGRLRLAIVSAYVWTHSVWLAFLRGLVQHLDIKNIELAIFHVGRKHDPMTGFAKLHAAHFQQGQRSTRAWAECILAWQPDVILYPEIGIDETTARLAGLRLASVQVAMWGHPHTTGFPTIDFFISAEGLEPADAATHYTERLIQLPGLGCCYGRSRLVPRPVDLHALGIRSGSPLLLSPGMPQKYLPQYDWVLTEIARRLGRCQIVFFTDDEIRPLTDVLLTRLQKAFTANDMTLSDYCLVLPWQTRASFFGLMQQADVMLDTIGFSGFNTVLQAVECGLPVVTLEGPFLRGRFGSGIMRAIGLDELVAANMQNYVDLAVSIVTDNARRAALVRQIEERRDSLFEDIGAVRAFEQWLLEVPLSGHG
jgi:protein O-GlcNAc transferase